MKKAGFRKVLESRCIHQPRPVQCRMIKPLHERSSSTASGLFFSQRLLLGPVAWVAFIAPNALTDRMRHNNVE